MENCEKKFFNTGSGLKPIVVLIVETKIFLQMDFTVSHNLLTLITLSFLVQNSNALICNRGSEFSHQTENCDGGSCRLIQFGGRVTRDCMLGYSHLKNGCRMDLSSNDSLLCFCQTDYCNSPLNISNDKEITTAFFPEITCHVYVANRSIATCLSSICYIGKHDNGLYYGGCFHGTASWITKYESMFQVWPYGHKLTNIQGCFGVTRYETSRSRYQVTCLCRDHNCNVPGIVEAPKINKPIECLLDKNSGRKCRGEYCFMLNHSRLTPWERECLSMSHYSLNPGELKTSIYDMWICQTPMCNANVTMAKRSINSGSFSKQNGRLALLISILVWFVDLISLFILDN